MGQLLYCSAGDAGVWGERLWWWLHRLGVTAVSPCFHGCLAFLHRHFPLQSPPSHPSTCLSAVHSIARPEIALQALNFSSQLLRLPGDQTAFLSRVCMAAARTIWFSFHLGCYRSAVSLSALNVSPLTQTIALMRGSNPCFSSPTQRGPVQSS